MSILALSELLGAAVRDASDATRGYVREVGVSPQDHPTEIAYLVVKTPSGERIVPGTAITAFRGTVRVATDVTGWEPYKSSGGELLLKRDLLDRQIIDVHGRKVVRVNDVEIESRSMGDRVVLEILAVDVGARGAIRRLCKGLVPSFTLRALLEKIPHRVIPWHYVDLLETDPARRVKLNIEYEGLARLHPADIADIVEDLPPAERGSVFETIDEEVAADTLEELELNVKFSVVEALDADRAADIVEEMDPDAAADLLGGLREEKSGEILRQMEPEERREVSELLEFAEHTAAGRMTTEFVSVADTGTVEDAINALKSFEGSREAMATIFLVSDGQKLTGAVPLVKIAVSAPATLLSALTEEAVSCPPDTPDREVAEIFDRYNLSNIAVIDADGRLSGLITADDVIAMLRLRAW